MKYNMNNPPSSNINSKDLLLKKVIGENPSAMAESIVKQFNIDEKCLFNIDETPNTEGMGKIRRCSDSVALPKTSKECLS